MTLRSLPLDDLRWDDLVRAAREHLVAASQGEWTLHAPVDPGVTILEAFAWELEQRLFRAGTPPEDVWWRVIDLFDLEPPQPSASARAVLSLRGERVVRLTIGDAVEFRSQGQVIRASVAHPATVVPDFVVAGIRVDQVDVTRRVEEAASNPSRPGVPAVGPDGRLSLSIELESSSLSSSQAVDHWHSLYLGLDAIGNDSIGNDSARPASCGWYESDDGRLDDGGYRIDGRDAIALGSPWPMRWTISTDGTPVAVDLLDGTDGLRRSGIVRWRHREGAVGGRRVALTVSSDASWPGPEPRLRRVAPNAVVVVHRRGLSLASATDDPGELDRQIGNLRDLPGQTVDLSSATAGDPLAEGSVSLQLREADGCWYEWEPTRALSLARGDDRVFQMLPPATLEFGDDVHGRIPRPMVPAEWRIVAEVGGGELSAVPASSSRRRQEWHVPASPGVTGQNVTDLVGGTGRTTLREWRQRQAVREPHRFVTPNDAERAVRAMAADWPLARVHGEVGLDPGAPGWDVVDALTMVCVPMVRTATPDDLRVPPVLDDALRLQIARVLGDRRLLGQRVFAVGPMLRPVAIAVHAQRRPASEVATRVDESVRRLLHPTAGSDDGTGWPFGAPISPVALAQHVRGLVASNFHVSRVTVTIEPRLGCRGASESQDCDLIPLRPFELPWVSSVGWVAEESP